MDDSPVLNARKSTIRKSSGDLGRKRHKGHEKRSSIAQRPNYLQNGLGHSTSLGIELLNKKDLFEFRNQMSDSQMNSALKQRNSELFDFRNQMNDIQVNSVLKNSKNSRKDSKIMQEENEEENEENNEKKEEKNEKNEENEENDDFGSELPGNLALSLNLEMMSSKKIISERNFSIPDEPNEQEGVLKELSSVSDLSGFSSKVFYCDKEVQVNLENEIFLSPKISKNEGRISTNEVKISKNEVFLPDYDLCNENIKRNSKIVQKIEINRDKFNEKDGKTSLKNDLKFFLMEHDSDDEPPRSKPENFSLKMNKSDKKEDKNTGQFYLENIEKKLTSISNLVSDFLRNFKENQKNANIFDSSKKNKFFKIHTNLNEMMKKLNRDHYIITHELLKKTMIKIDSQTLKTLNYHKLITLIFEGYSKKNEGFIEYNINFEDVLMKKTWKFQIRYSKLRNFHKECQNFLSEIKLDENFIGSLPPFPPKKWFGNTEEEFLKSRLKDLETYFQTIMTSPLCIQIIEKGILRYFLYKEIWKFESEDLKRKCEKIEKWEGILQNSLLNLKNEQNKGKNEENKGKNEQNKGKNEENNINYEKIGGFMKEEIQKVCVKLENVKNDLEILEKNDSFSILRYEEKRKKLEKELSVRESFNENEFNGLLT